MKVFVLEINENTRWESSYEFDSVYFNADSLIEKLNEVTNDNYRAAWIYKITVHDSDICNSKFSNEYYFTTRNYHRDLVQQFLKSHES